MSEPLTPLLERLRAATCADRQLDSDLSAALRQPGRVLPGWAMKPEWGWHSEQGRLSLVHNDGRRGLNWEAAMLTGSIDAAVALVERKLPGWTWGIDTHSAKGPCGIVSKGGEISFDEAGEVEVAYAPTAPIALLVTLLSALIAQGDA